MAISPSDYVCLSQNLSFLTKVYSGEVCGHEAWLTQVTWEPTTDKACKKEQAIQEMIKPERLRKTEIEEWEVTATLLCFT